jgi:hypothetical protein
MKTKIFLNMQLFQSESWVQKCARLVNKARMSGQKYSQVTDKTFIKSNLSMTKMSNFNLTREPISQWYQTYQNLYYSDESVEIMQITARKIAYILTFHKKKECVKYARKITENFVVAFLVFVFGDESWFYYFAPICKCSY